MMPFMAGFVTQVRRRQGPDRSSVQDAGRDWNGRPRRFTSFRRDDDLDSELGKILRTLKRATNDSDTGSVSCDGCRPYFVGGGGMAGQRAKEGPGRSDSTRGSGAFMSGTITVI
jgi:hypothetical protein